MPCVTIYSIYKCSGNAGNPLFRPSSHFRLFSGFSGTSGMSLGLGICRGCLPRAALHPATRPPRAAGPRHQSRPSPCPWNFRGLPWAQIYVFLTRIFCVSYLFIQMYVLHTLSELTALWIGLYGLFAGSSTRTTSWPSGF